MNSPFVDEAMLHAYVDGRLPEAQAAQVAHWLEQHPADAARVAAWQAQRHGLRTLHVDLLGAPVPAGLRAAVRPVRRRLTATWAAAMAAGWLLAGIGLGWSARPWLEARVDAFAAAPSTVPAMVRDAALAHVLYVPEQRHPVEVGAEQEQHLVQWLSRRLGAPLRVPILVGRGWHLVGGRLLPAGEALPAPADRTRSGAAAQAVATLARAQFMYERAGGARLTLYVAVSGDASAPPAAFRITEGPAGAVRSFYWVDGGLGYALTGDLPGLELADLAGAVHLQLGR